MIKGFRHITRALRGFRRDEDGAATVEFVIIAPLFFAIVFSMFESGWLMTRSMMLDRGLDLAVRDVRLDILKNPTHTQMKERVCQYARILEDCKTTMILQLNEISVGGGYPSANANCFDRTETVTPVINFTPGARSRLMFVRACIVVDPIFPGLGLGLKMPKDPSGGITMISYSAFVNEPS